jgi:hypothetical protein
MPSNKHQYLAKSRGHFNSYVQITEICGMLSAIEWKQK